MTTDEMETGEYGRGTRGYGTGGDTHRIVDEAEMNVDGGRAPGALQRHIGVHTGPYHERNMRKLARGVRREGERVV